MQFPLVSVVIPLFNKEKEISVAVASVLNQSYPDFECIIINDGSTDSSLKALEGFSDNRIRIISQSNGGVSKARNRGIKEAQGQWIAFLDADDRWTPEFLNTMISLAEKYPHCRVIGSAVGIESASGEQTKPLQRGFSFEKEGEIMNYFEIASHSHPPLHSSAIMIHKDALSEIGGFPEDINSGEDLLTWAKLARNNRIAYTRETKAIYYADTRRAINKSSFRLPDNIDTVGRELAYLYRQNSSLPGLRAYVGLWHKMRAHAYIAAGLRRNALPDVWKMLKYKITFKGLLLTILAFCPKSVGSRVLKV